MQLTDGQRKILDRLAADNPFHPLLPTEIYALRAALAALDARAAEIERLRAEATALRSEVAALGALIARHEARARAWEYGPGGED
jgi:hypothetical protein